ncbi:rho family-interacting cell polarization regulator 1-like [Kryptolebias marmoratus]|nr:rho family-interacting cell polarization regulator 1-like [Kryptolebias marmoratus]
MSTLFTLYSGFLCERADTVLLCLVERVLEQRLAQRGRRDEPVVTLFQLWNYLESNGINDVESHIIALAEEVDLVQNLLSRDQDVITETLHLPSECSLKREGLKTIAKLLTDPREKVLASASSVLRILAGQHKQREQALLNCLEMLEDDEVDTRVCGCKALACLKATESIEQLMYLCENDNNDVQEAAMQTLLELGDEGKTALRRLGMSQDIIPDSPLPDSWPDRPSTSAYEHQSNTAY